MSASRLEEPLQNEELLQERHCPHKAIEAFLLEYKESWYLELMLSEKPLSRQITWKQSRALKYRPFSPRPVKNPTIFYGVRLGYVKGVYMRWKQA